MSLLLVDALKYCGKNPTYGLRLQNTSDKYCNCRSIVYISHNQIQHSMTKYINIRYHFIKDNILNGDIKLIFVPSTKEIADVYTKYIDPTNFNNLLEV